MIFWGCPLYFNPLPHTRENRYNGDNGLSIFYFNPLPHTRENVKPDSVYNSVDISIHSLIRGRTTSLTSLLRRCPPFQSTPSYEGEPTDDDIDIQFEFISIHSLIRGRTRFRLSFQKQLRISIHSLIRGRTKQGRKLLIQEQFQSTPSYEGERQTNCDICKGVFISIHSLIRGRTHGQARCRTL